MHLYTSPSNYQRAATPRPQHRSRRWLSILAIAGVAASPAVIPTVAYADPGVDEISIVDGETAAVFAYDEAIRERVFIPIPGVDQDLDGVDDVTAIDIVRPQESDSGLAVPAIIDASPYYTTVGRGNESEFITDVDGDGVNDTFPLFYDNYFVERGYATILAHMDGTGFSTGCPLQGGPGDIASMKVVIDWLQGRAAGFDAAGEPALATWHNGKAGMIGKSYDGTLANGVAATGVEGLSTIVPISAISNWYGYSRTGGIRHNTDYAAGLSNNVTNPERRALCAPTRDAMSLADGDETGDINQFWAERDYRATVDQVTASVLLVHGLNDDNVRMSQVEQYWNALGDNDVPRKIWLARLGHVDPFDFARDEWVETLHHWFDYWLQGIDNGIMTEPMATVESMEPGVMEDFDSWPLPGTEGVGVNLAATEPGTAGRLQLGSNTGAESLTFTGTTGGRNASETSFVTDPEGQQDTRLSFLSEPLATDLRISGTAMMDITANLNLDQSNFAAFLVDYGTQTRIPRSPGDGVITTERSSCWGGANEFEDACYLEVDRRSADVDLWRVSRGVLDSSNRESLIDGDATPVVPGQDYGFTWPLEPYDHVFPAGHRIGVVVTTNLSGFVTDAGVATTVDLDTSISRIVLPVVGGEQAAVAAQAFGAPDPSLVTFDVAGIGADVAAQTVAYGDTALAPTDPSADGYVFQGWFADAAFTVPFDFTAPVTTDTIVYAQWSTVADAVASITIDSSDTTVNQGDDVTVTVSGYDADGAPLGDVTELATITSSVTTDVIAGNRITFVSASPHTITAVLGDATASVVIEVVPAAVPEPGEDSTPAGDLASTGTEPLVPIAVTLTLLVLGAAALLIARRRRIGTKA